MKTPITMREVAAHCGCSQPTISLCLSNSPVIPEATKRRVREAAALLGYRKHPLVAAHMRTRRKRGAAHSGPVLALINAQLSADGWRKNTSSVLREMLAGAVSRARERGYTPQEFWLHERGMTSVRLSDILRARGITGLLIGPSSHLELDLAFEWDAFSCVQLGSARLRPTLHRIVNDHYQATMLAVRECHALGYRRPGFAVQDAFSLCHDRRWEAGFAIGCEQFPEVKPVPTLRLESMNDRAAFLAWFRKHRPDVVIEATERMARAHLASASYLAPRDVGVVTLGAPRLQGPTTGTVQDGHAMGTHAIDLLVSLVERNETGIPIRPITQMTASAWNLGDAVRAQASRATAGDERHAKRQTTAPIAPHP